MHPNAPMNVCSFNKNCQEWWYREHPRAWEWRSPRRMLIETIMHKWPRRMNIGCIRPWWVSKRALYRLFTRTWLRYVRVFAVAVPSVCRLSSVYNVGAPYSGVEAFGNISSPLCTLAILWHQCKILRRSSRGNPSVGALNARGVSKESDFGPKAIMIDV